MDKHLSVKRAAETLRKHEIKPNKDGDYIFLAEISRALRFLGYDDLSIKSCKNMLDRIAENKFSGADKNG